MATPAQPEPPMTGNVLFYSRPEPLNKEQHAGLGLRRVEKPFGFAAHSHVVPLTVTEFPVAALTYPIIFAGDKYQPLAVMGLNNDQNMFINADGGFEQGAYIPAYIRRYPFVLANDQVNEQLVVCIDRDAGLIGEDYDIPFFNEQGEGTEYTMGCIQFCNDFETEARRTEAFVQVLRDNDLFETRRTTYTPSNPDGSAAPPQPVAEYFAVSEEKLKTLGDQKLRELLNNGVIGQIYAHLVSLVGWDRLITMSVMRQAAIEQQAMQAANN
jgi:hypothetical protein